MTDPVGFFRERYVELWNRGVELLSARSSESERASRIIEDIRAAEGAAWLVFEGGGEVWLRWSGGAMVASDAKPDAPVRLSIALPADAARVWVEKVLEHSPLDSDEAAVRTARGTSARFERTLGDESLNLHLIITDTPDFGEVVVRIGVHAAEPPAQPTFTATVAWGDLTSARERGEDLSKLFMAGRLKLGGDYSRALQVAMQLMQQGPL